MASNPSDRNRRSGIRVRGTLTVAFLHDFELNALSLAQRAVTARHGEHREVNEDIVHSCRQ
jgi:hypothetical protein